MAVQVLCFAADVSFFLSSVFLCFLISGGCMADRRQTLPRVRLWPRFTMQVRNLGVLPIPYSLTLPIDPLPQLMRFNSWFFLALYKLIYLLIYLFTYLLSYLRKTPTRRDDLVAWRRQCELCLIVKQSLIRSYPWETNKDVIVTS